MAEQENKVESFAEATSQEKAEEMIRILDRKLARDIKWISTSGATEITDYYITATGRSRTHVLALANELEYEMALRGVKAAHMEGRDGGEWLLLDFSDVIVHIFGKEARDFYRFERLYQDEDFLSIDALIAEEKADE